MSLAVLAVVGVARPTEGAPGRRHRPISAITLTHEGSGSLIRIIYAGRLHSFTRILRSHEPLDAVAVTDVDDDGDQDIAAVWEVGDLVLCRHGRRPPLVVAPRARD